MVRPLKQSKISLASNSIATARAKLSPRSDLALRFAELQKECLSIACERHSEWEQIQKKTLKRFQKASPGLVWAPASLEASSRAYRAAINNQKSLIDLIAERAQQSAKGTYPPPPGHSKLANNVAESVKKSFQQSLEAQKGVQKVIAQRSKAIAERAQKAKRGAN